MCPQSKRPNDFARLRRSSSSCNRALHEPPPPHTVAAILPDSNLTYPHPVTYDTPLERQSVEASLGEVRWGPSRKLFLEESGGKFDREVGLQDSSLCTATSSDQFQKGLRSATARTNMGFFGEFVSAFCGSCRCASEGTS